MRRHMCAKLEKRTWAKPKRRMSISLRTNLLSWQIAIRMLYSNTIDYYTMNASELHLLMIVILQS